MLNAVEQNNLEGVSLLVMDATLKVLQVLALINRQPFITFASYISQARQFPIKPERFDDLLDILVQGTYQDLPLLREVVLAVFMGMEKIFAERGFPLYDDPFDPNLPNPVIPSPAVMQEGSIRLVQVDQSNWRQCVKLPTGDDHKYVAPNVYSIAEAQFWAGSKSCCIYHAEEMVGYTLYNLDYDDDFRRRLWVGRLMIAEPQRGKGYARAAMHQIIAEARQQSCFEVALSTELENFKAIRTL